MPAAVVIRIATANDLSSIRQCAIAAYTKYIQRIGKNPAPMVADFAKLIEACQVYVACSESALVGFVVFYPMHGSMHLENIAVFPKFAGQGVGRLLVEYVEFAATKAGIDSVNLYTNEAMTENLALYPALGYVERERRAEDGFKRVYFEKYLIV